MFFSQRLGGVQILTPPEKVFLIQQLYCDVRYRSGNTLRFPRARDEPPHSQRTLVAGSHRLRFPAGVFVYFLR